MPLPSPDKVDALVGTLVDQINRGLRFDEIFANLPPTTPTGRAGLGPMAAACLDVRMGHGIPTGATDAVSYSKEGAVVGFVTTLSLVLGGGPWSPVDLVLPEAVCLRVRMLLVSKGMTGSNVEDTLGLAGRLPDCVFGNVRWSTTTFVWADAQTVLELRVRMETERTRMGV